MTKRDEESLLHTVQREFDQLRALMAENHAFMQEHVKTDDARNDKIAAALSIQNALVAGNQQRLDSFILYSKWVAGGMGTLVLAAASWLIGR